MYERFWNIQQNNKEPKSTSWMDFQNRMSSILKPSQGMEGQKCSAVQRKDNILARPHNNLENDWASIGGQWALFFAWVKQPLQIDLILL